MAKCPQVEIIELKERVAELQKSLEMAALNYDGAMIDLRHFEGLANERKWVPVSEKPPEGGDRVMLGHYYDDRWIWVASGEWEGGEWWCDFTDDSFKAICHHSVTHWMPLEPPP